MINNINSEFAVKTNQARCIYKIITNNVPRTESWGTEEIGQKLDMCTMEMSESERRNVYR